MGKRQLLRRERASLGARSQGGTLYALSGLSTPSLGHLPPGEARAAYLQSYAFVEFLVGPDDSGEWIIEVDSSGVGVSLDYTLTIDINSPSCDPNEDLRRWQLTLAWRVVQWRRG